MGNYIENVYLKEAFLATIFNRNNPIKLNNSIPKPNKIALFAGLIILIGGLPTKKMIALLTLLNKHKIVTILIVSTQSESIYFTEKN